MGQNIVGIDAFDRPPLRTCDAPEHGLQVFAQGHVAQGAGVAKETEVGPCGT